MLVPGWGVLSTPRFVKGIEGRKNRGVGVRLSTPSILPRRPDPVDRGGSVVPGVSGRIPLSRISSVTTTDLLSRVSNSSLHCPFRLFG